MITKIALILAGIFIVVNLGRELLKDKKQQPDTGMLLPIKPEQSISAIYGWICALILLIYLLALKYGGILRNIYLEVM